jgi:hypothetical protein
LVGAISNTIHEGTTQQARKRHALASRSSQARPLRLRVLAGCAGVLRGKSLVTASQMPGIRRRVPGQNRMGRAAVCMPIGPAWPSAASTSFCPRSTRTASSRKSPCVAIWTAMYQGMVMMQNRLRPTQ